MPQRLFCSLARFAQLMAVILFCTLVSSSPHAQVVPLGNVTKVTAGNYHTCVLTTAGGVKCWGNNFKGQLGDNSTTNHLTPTDVTGLASGVTAIAAGDFHTCALTAAGGVKCWGNNFDGQLGDNSNTDRLAPVDVTGLASGVMAIAAGGFHTCALTTAGGVKCWGYNFAGQLGNNATTSRVTPVEATGLGIGVTAIAAGGLHTCALTTAGAVKCWGDNYFGQIGDDSDSTRLTPVDVSGLSRGMAAIATGDSHSCALSAAGAVKCWGYNNSGQLGDGTNTNRWSPVDVTGLAREVTAIDAGYFHTCALTATGGVKCWGYNFEGELGDNSVTNRWSPVAVSGLASVITAIDAGYFHTCALTSAGGLKCWGNNHDGQLGDTSVTNRLTPVDVMNIVSAGLPGAPTAVSAIAGNAQAAVSFTAPASNGGTAITGYTVTSSPGGFTASGTASPITVIGLTNGTAYTFTVTAANGVGTSAASSASASVTPSCSIAISPAAQSASASGLAGNVSVTAAPGCTWAASSNAGWISITSGASGSGNGNVVYSVLANAGTARTGTLSIAGLTFTVTQAGACTSTLAPGSSYISSASGTGSVTITASGSCPWTATSNASWISLTSATSGTGSGTATYSVTANSGSDARTGTLTIGGTSFAVVQSGTGADGNVTQVQSMYIAYFGRPADPGGLAYYSNLMYTRNGSYAAILDDFANSAESLSLYNQPTVPAKLDQVYTFLFARVADRDGSAYWSNLISTGQILLSNAAYIIAYNAQSTDAAILSAKRSSAATFTAHLDLTSEIQAYVNSVTTGRTWLAQVVDSASGETANSHVDATIGGM